MARTNASEKSKAKNREKEKDVERFFKMLGIWEEAYREKILNAGKLEVCEDEGEFSLWTATEGDEEKIKEMMMDLKRFQGREITPVFIPSIFDVRSLERGEITVDEIRATGF